MPRLYMGLGGNCIAANLDVTGVDRGGQERTRVDRSGHSFREKFLDAIWEEERGVDYAHKMHRPI